MNKTLRLIVNSDSKEFTNQKVVDNFLYPSIEIVGREPLQSDITLVNFVKGLKLVAQAQGVIIPEITVFTKVVTSFFIRELLFDLDKIVIYIEDEEKLSKLQDLVESLEETSLFLTCPMPTTKSVNIKILFSLWSEVPDKYKDYSNRVINIEKVITTYNQEVLKKDESIDLRRIYKFL